jgi:hypothetical protein
VGLAMGPGLDVVMLLNNDSEAYHWDVKANEHPIRLQKETGGIRMGRYVFRITTRDM